MTTLQVLVLLAAVACVSAKSLPKFITKCHRSNPNLEQCVLDQVEKLRPRLLKGIPELHIPPYDPVEIPQVVLEQGTSAVKFKAVFTNMKAFGARFAKIDKIRIDLKKPSIEIGVFLPQVHLKTKYDISGKVLLVPIKGIGNGQGNFTDLLANMTVNAEYVQKKDGQYIRLTDRRVKLKLGGCKLHFDNLFNGNRELTESTNRFFNENWQDIVHELAPVIEETIATLVLQLVGHVFENYSVDELLPP